MIRIYPARCCRQVVALAMLLAPLVAGCTSWNPPNWNLRGEADHDSFAESSGFQRPRDDDRQVWSFSSKARQIERDLGVR